MPFQSPEGFDSWSLEQKNSVCSQLEVQLALAGTFDTESQVSFRGFHDRPRCMSGPVRTLRGTRVAAVPSWSEEANYGVSV
jgi:hypothetical protein